MSNSLWWRAGLMSPLLAIALAADAGVNSGPVLDEGLTVGIEDFWTPPASSGSRPFARLNVLREAPDGSGRLFVNDLRGPLHVLDGGTTHLFLDLSTLVSNFKTSPGLASGFVSVALHPDYGTNGLFYTVHTESLGAGTPAPNLTPPLPITVLQHSVLTEWETATPASNSFSQVARRELMRIASPGVAHNLGEIAFRPNAAPTDPDRAWLVIGAGEFGTTASQHEQSQRLDTVYGAVLRIDPAGSFSRGGTNYGYGIPSTNPYDDGDPDTWDEILAHGFRNAHRVLWDPDTDELYVADIGRNHMEELDAITPGENYGWPFREGTLVFDPVTLMHSALPPNDPTFGYTYPAAQYDHEEGDAIAGAAWPGSGGITELQDKVVFGDIVTGRLFYAYADDLRNSDGTPGATAPIYELHLEAEGMATDLLTLVRAATGSGSLSRTDLRLHTTLGGTVHLTTKQDGRVRRLVTLVPKVPSLSAGARLALLAVLALGGTAGAWRGARARA